MMSENNPQNMLAITGPGTTAGRHHLVVPMVCLGCLTMVQTDAVAFAGSQSCVGGWTAGRGWPVELRKLSSCAGLQLVLSRS